MTRQMTRGSQFPAASGSDTRLSQRGLLHLSAALWLCLPTVGMAQAVLPEGGSVASGAVTIVRPNGSTMTINQGSNTAIVNWGSFSIGNGATVNIHQPNTNSAILNRVTGTTTSQIHGQLNANGTVHLVNPNGIFIGPNGTVNAGSFAASTLDISDADFKAGRLQYNGLGNSGTVENAGRVTIGRGGYAALIGGKVKNSGTVTVPYGRIGFAAGEQVVLDVSGDQFLQVAIPSNSPDDGEALITNSGTASAEGGLIEMRAATARHAARHAINLSGVAEASSVAVRGGTIVLGGGAGGKVTVSGRVSTRPKRANIVVDQSKRPPSIDITGREIALNGAQIDASASNGGGLIRIGGDFGGEGDLLRADTVISDPNTVILADALTSGDGGRVVLWSDFYTEFPATISARGGDVSGDGGFVEVSSRRVLNYSGSVDRRAPNGAWGTLWLDPTDITINSGTLGAGTDGQLESDLALGSVVLDTSDTPGSDPGNITINADIDWTATTTLTLRADNDILLNGSLNGSNGFVVLTGDALIVDASQVFRSGSVTVNVTDFEMDGGRWEDVGGPLGAFNVSNNFDLNGNNFLRLSGGNGGSASPFLIADVFGLQGLTSPSYYGESFALANNIDATVTERWDRGNDDTGFAPIDFFDGESLDGRGFKIIGLEQEETNGEGEFEIGGLFSTIGAASVVENLILEEFDIVARNSGILANRNLGTVRNVLVSGEINSDGNSVGGLVGFNSGSITDSGADVDVNVTTNPSSNSMVSVGGAIGSNVGTVTRTHSIGPVNLTNSSSVLSANIGGFVGEETGGGMTISDSFSNSDVTVTSNVGSGANVNIGGFAGSIDGTVDRNLSTGRVTANGDAIVNQGGFAGTVLSGSNSNSNFFDVNTSGQASSPYGVGLTTAQMQNTEAFAALAAAQGWDFNTVWAPGDTGQYAVNYSTTAVIVATPNDITVQYGQTGTASTTLASVTGGPDLFLFDQAGDTLDTSGQFTPLTFDAVTVGQQGFGLGQTSITSANGVSYRIVDRRGTATITPAPLTIRANDQTKIEGTTFTFNGTEFSTSGLQFSDSVSRVDLFSLGAASDASSADSPFAITASNASGSGLGNYTISFAPGSFEVVTDTVEIPIPPIFNGFPLPNPTDGIDDGQSNEIETPVSTFGTSVSGAEQTLALVEDISEALEIAADSCGQGGGDVTRYLACLADALNEFSDELDAISADLPPGMQNVARIVQDARVQIDQSRVRAQRRLATATTSAQRDAIRRDAANEARSALNTAAGEIRKSIALVRADDPELASVQRATITRVANTVDNVGIKLTRAVGL